MKILDIGSTSINTTLTENSAAIKLSNFSEFPFYIDGVFCRSMEGFLQALKYKDRGLQIEICNLSGFAAKRKGSKKNWKKDQTLYWNGSSIDRHSDEYQMLLDRAFTEIFKNKEYESFLRQTIGFTLTHSVGKTNPHYTVLTIDEFCERLTTYREYKLRD